MLLRVFTEPQQGALYDDQLAVKPVNETAELFARVRSACAAAGRAPETLALSVGTRDGRR